MGAEKCAVNALLARIGVALYGERWQSAIARDLEVNIRTVQRWAAGEVEPSWAVFAELLVLLNEKAAELGFVAADVRLEPN